MNHDYEHAFAFIFLHFYVIYKCNHYTGLQHHNDTVTM
jgi:hypothetical protein